MAELIDWGLILRQYNAYMVEFFRAGWRVPISPATCSHPLVQRLADGTCNICRAALTQGPQDTK